MSILTIIAILGFFSGVICCIAEARKTDKQHLKLFVGLIAASVALFIFSEQAKSKYEEVIADAGKVAPASTTTDLKAQPDKKADTAKAGAADNADNKDAKKDVVDTAAKADPKPADEAPKADAPQDADKPAAADPAAVANAPGAAPEKAPEPAAAPAPAPAAPAAPAPAAPAPAAPAPAKDPAAAAKAPAAAPAGNAPAAGKHHHHAAPAAPAAGDAGGDADKKALIESIKKDLISQGFDPAVAEQAAKDAVK